jgi:hypothetical protein
LGADEVVILNPPDSLTDGVQVHIAAPSGGSTKDAGKAT